MEHQQHPLPLPSTQCTFPDQLIHLMQLALHAEHFKINESQKKITTVSSNDPAPLPPRTGNAYISKMFVVYMCVCVDCVECVSAKNWVRRENSQNRKNAKTLWALKSDANKWNFNKFVCLAFFVLGKRHPTPSTPPACLPVTHAVRLRGLPNLFSSIMPSIHSVSFAAGSLTTRA